MGIELRHDHLRGRRAVVFLRHGHAVGLPEASDLTLHGLEDAEIDLFYGGTARDRPQNQLACQGPLTAPQRLEVLMRQGRQRRAIVEKRRQIFRHGGHSVYRGADELAGTRALFPRQLLTQHVRQAFQMKSQIDTQDLPLNEHDLGPHHVVHKERLAVQCERLRQIGQMVARILERFLSAPLSIPAGELGMTGKLALDQHGGDRDAITEDALASPLHH